MSFSHLLPFTSTASARAIRLSHNEHKANGNGTVRQFIRAHGLVGAFGSREDLKCAIERNELWLLTIVRADSTRTERIASSRFSTLVELDCKVPILAAESKVAPPLPRHDDIVLECNRQGPFETWSVVWQEYVGYRYTVRSASLLEVMRRGLEISAGNAEGAFRAFEHWTISH